MRQLQINPKGRLVSTALNHNLGILTSVEQLGRFDMIYIYHHLKIGEELELIRDHSNPFEPYGIDVFFKGFKVGVVSPRTNRLNSKLIDKGAEVKATVKGLSKQKYMPLEGLDIEIKALVD